MNKQAIYQHLETVAAELIASFDITYPPIPVESMLQSPQEGMWQEVDVTQMSGTFLNVKDLYSPRMSLSRLLARHVAFSPWGKERQLADLLKDEELLKAFARMMVMPAPMIEALSSGQRTPTAMSMHFEVPAEDARHRLNDLLSYS